MRFGAKRVVDGVDLVVRRGTVVGLLGPNGAGKTTTGHLLATLLAPDGGRVRMLGYDLVREAPKIRACISLKGQFASLDEDLTGFENVFGRPAETAVNPVRSPFPSTISPSDVPYWMRCSSPSPITARRAAG
jgi:ABC-type branched-subunit amino acid transport system ATPase component